MTNPLKNLNEILCANAFEITKTFPNDSIDLIVCDGLLTMNGIEYQTFK